MRLPSIQFPLVEFSRYLQNQGLSLNSTLLYIGAVRRVLRLHGLDVSTAELRAHRAGLTPSIQIRLNVAWSHFVTHAKLCGRTVAKLPEASVAIEYPELRKLLPAFLTLTKLKPQQVAKMRVSDVTREQHPDGIFWIFNAYHGKKWGMVRHPVEDSLIMPVIMPIFEWGQPGWAGHQPDMTRPLLPSAPGSDVPMRALVIELIVEQAAKKKTVQVG